MSKKSLPAQEQEALIAVLKARFEKHETRHKGVTWAEVEKRLRAKPEALSSLQQMEETGGEPDVVKYDKKTGEVVFFDCSAESPAGRRSFCYDREALDSRKENKPKNCAMDVVKAMGADLLNEEEYRFLQSLGHFDAKTSSWIATPAAIRKLGGALFADYRYDTVFVYHNGAESYYAARGFRVALRV